MKHLYKTKRFLFRIFLAGIFLILYAVTASAVPVSAQSGISDDQRKASASLITWNAYQGLDEAELSSRVWQFCGRAEHGTLPGETYYDGALYVETLGDRSDYFVLAGDSLAWTGYSQGRSLNSALALWTAPDPMARDFSSINPYVYCASNPIRYIDPTGCEYVFNNITAEDKETIIRILSTGTSGALSFSFDKNVLKAKIIDENAKLSDAEKVIFDYLTREEETSITIENNSTTVLIGEADTAKMDLKDITNLGSQGPANDIGAFMHELIEQYYLQKHKANKEKMGEKKYNEIKGSAHIKATRQEAIINGVLIDKDRIIHSTYILFKYNPDKNLPWTKETHYPKYIKIPIKGKNVIKRK